MATLHAFYTLITPGCVTNAHVIYHGDGDASQAPLREVLARYVRGANELAAELAEELTKEERGG